MKRSVWHLGRLQLLAFPTSLLLRLPQLLRLPHLHLYHLLHKHSLPRPLLLLPEPASLPLPVRQLHLPHSSCLPQPRSLLPLGCLLTWPLSQAPAAPVAAAAATPKTVTNSPSPPPPPSPAAGQTVAPVVRATPVLLPAQAQLPPVTVSAAARPAEVQATAVPAQAAPQAMPACMPPALMAALARPNLSAQEHTHLFSQAKQPPFLAPTHAAAKKAPKLCSKNRLDRECAICLGELPFVGFLPCKHRVMCHGCADKWVAKKALCSHCSQPINGIEE